MEDDTIKYERELHELRSQSTGALIKRRFTFGAGNPYTEFIIDKELARRDMEEQLRVTMNAARWQAYFGIGGVVIGVVVAKLLDLLK